ncbi:MAG: hypothetical protein KC474_08825 [Cyanobacteria bacterium HKST-UBA04]|nr:hypothetical protein [Cyanobacteria bacterium HKST-UBA04]
MTIQPMGLRHSVAASQPAFGVQRRQFLQWLGLAALGSQSALEALAHDGPEQAGSLAPPPPPQPAPAPYDYQAMHPVLTRAYNDYLDFERLADEENLFRSNRRYNRERFDTLLNRYFPDADDRAMAVDQLEHQTLEQMRNDICLPYRDELMALAIPYAMVKSSDKRLQAIAERRRQLPANEQVARRHFERLLADVPPLDIDDPRLQHKWPQDTYVIAPINQENSVMESWCHGAWMLGWRHVPRDCALAHVLVDNLTDGTPLPFEQEYPALNAPLSRDVSTTTEYRKPVARAPRWARDFFLPEKLPVTATTNIRPQSSSNVAGARLWDPAETRPRSLLIIVGDDHEGFQGSGYDWFKRNALHFRDGMVQAYKDKGLDEKDARIIWKPSPQKVENGFKRLRRFARAHAGEHPQTMVYVLGHGHIVGREAGIPREEEFRPGAGIWEVALNHGVDPNDGAAYDMTDTGWKQFFTDYLDGYDQKVFHTFSCMAGGSVAQNDSNPNRLRRQWWA